jgi:hypothetical protein
LTINPEHVDNAFAESPPIPEEFWVEIKRFLKEKKAGSLTLHVSDNGKVVKLGVNYVKTIE